MSEAVSDQAHHIGVARRQLVKILVNSEVGEQLNFFFRVDAGIYATIDKTWSAQLNIENIFDKGYWASADGNNNLSPGNPRTIRLSATARF